MNLLRGPRVWLIQTDAQPRPTFYLLYRIFAIFAICYIEYLLRGPRGWLIQTDAQPRPTFYACPPLYTRIREQLMMHFEHTKMLDNPYKMYKKYMK